MKWLLYRTYPNLVLENWIRAKEEEANVNNWSTTNNHRFINKEVTIPKPRYKVIAAKQLALANDLYENLKQTPSPPLPPSRDYPRIYFRLSF